MAVLTEFKRNLRKVLSNSELDATLASLQTGTLAASGDVSAEGALAVTGGTSLTGGLSVGGAQILGGALGVGGAASFGSTVDVLGVLTAGSITVGGVAWGPGMLLEAADTTERSTANTALTDLSTITTTPSGGALSIDVEKPLLIVLSYRKTTGAADSIGIGLKINGTTINAGRVVTGVTNAADDGVLFIEIAPRLANYTHAISARFVCATVSPAPAPDYYATAAGLPTANITSIVIAGRTGATSSLTGITMAIQDVRVYSYPTS